MFNTLSALPQNGEIRALDFMNKLVPDELHNAIETGQLKCPNPKCPHILDDTDWQNIQQDHGWFVCPICQTSFFMEDDPRQEPGGYTRAQGLSMSQMGQIGEQVVDQMGEVPGLGKIITYYGTDMYHNPIDFQIGKFGVEVKTIHSEAQPRFKLTGGGGRSRQRGIQEMTNFCEQYGLQPAMVGVRLNFYSDRADIFARQGFADTWIGSKNMPHVATVDFRSLNPYKDPSEVPPPNEMPDDQDTDSDIPF